MGLTVSIRFIGYSKKLIKYLNRERTGIDHPLINTDGVIGSVWIEHLY